MVAHPHERENFRVVFLLGTGKRGADSAADDAFGVWESELSTTVLDFPVAAV
jgi:hypothetical protein